MFPVTEISDQGIRTLTIITKSISILVSIPELHLQRLKSLRESSDKLKDDSWKYPSVDKLLGL